MKFAPYIGLAILLGLLAFEIVLVVELFQRARESWT